VGIVVQGPAAYLYFGQADLAVTEMLGSRFPDLLTLVLAVIFADFGLYALSGAGRIRRLPLLFPALFFIGGLYTLRGLILILDLQKLFQDEGYPLRQAVFSAVALAVGLVTLAGAWGERTQIRSVI
jgi:hypothetical protein